MASYVPVIKNGANGAILYVGLVDQSNTKLLKSTPTLASGDFKVSIDGGALANLGTLPTVTPAAGRQVKITLSQAEVNGDNITIQCVDAAGAEWCDLLINIQTVARQIDDLAFPTTSGRSIDVAATGEVGLDFNNILSSATATLNALTITNGLTVSGATALTGNVALADGLTIAAPSTGNRAGITITGNGTGAGIIATGGSTGDGIKAVGGASGHGLTASGTGTTKHGINATGGATTSAGIAATGGATSGDGVLISAPTLGHAINATGAGASKHGALLVSGSSSGNGLNIVGGSSSGAGIQITTTSGDGISSTPTAGHGLTLTGQGTTKHGINATGGATTSHGAVFTGGGVGHGIFATSGNGATGDGIRGTSAATNGNGLNLVGNGTGDGILATGGASAGGDGMELAAGGGVSLRATTITGTLSNVTTVTTVTNQLTGAAIATSIWQDATAGDFTAANSVGKSVMNGVALGTGLTINGYTGNTPQTGDGYARLGAPVGASVSADVLQVKNYVDDIGVAGAGLTALGDTRIANLDATVSSRLASASYTAPPSAATIAQAVWDALTSALTTVGSIGKLLVTNIDAAISSRLATSGYTVPPTANANADALLDRTDGIETGLTVRGALRLDTAVLAGKVSGAGTGTEVFRNAVADSKPRVTATVTAAGNRATITTDSA